MKYDPTKKMAKYKKVKKLRWTTFIIIIHVNKSILFYCKLFAGNFACIRYIFVEKF